MRRIRSVAFSGSDSWWKSKCLLHGRLEEALDKISGLQQPLCCTTEKDIWDADQAERKKEWEEVHDMVRDIVCGLLGPYAAHTLKIGECPECEGDEYLKSARGCKICGE